METGLNLQSKLSNLVDRCRANSLEALLHNREDWNGKRRLSELRDNTVCHDWLWSLNPCHGPIVPPAEYLAAIRLRLGAPAIDTPIACKRCGREDLDRSCSHALCCALPEATRGHNNIREVVLNLSHLADPRARIKDESLIPSRPTLRPADILTSAAFPGLSALDVGVISPDSAHAGDDCCEAMRKKKCEDYGPYLEELVQNGVKYQSFIFSAHGRAHLETESILLTLSLGAARC